MKKKKKEIGREGEREKKGDGLLPSSSISPSFAAYLFFEMSPRRADPFHPALFELG